MGTSLSRFFDQAGITINGNAPFDIHIHNKRLFHRLALYGSLAAGESYMDGWWDCGALDEFFARLFRIEADQSLHSFWYDFGGWLQSQLVNLQNKRRSVEVADRHYNLNNKLYEQMLGSSMAYTCGYWANAQDLETAQVAKLTLVAEKLQLKPKERVLDLGCGFGSFSRFAAERYGCEIVAVNISSEQVAYAKKWTENLPVQVYLCDYRDVAVYNPNNQPFDKVASIGLCEHVGPRNYKTFISVLRQNLKPDGLCLLHTIGGNKKQWRVDPWIQKYIFPNGHIPSMAELATACEGLFVIEDIHNFGNDYDLTLMAWYRNFKKAWPLLKAEHDERFYRLWVFYLLSCAGAFRARTLQLWQWVLSPLGVVGGYRSIR